jgi:hypothetical protein
VIALGVGCCSRLIGLGVGVRSQTNLSSAYSQPLDDIDQTILAALLTNRLQAVPGVVRTQTIITLTSHKDTPALPLKS